MQKSLLFIVMFAVLFLCVSVSFAIAQSDTNTSGSDDESDDESDESDDLNDTDDSDSESDMDDSGGDSNETESDGSDDDSSGEEEDSTEVGVDDETEEEIEDISVEDNGKKYGAEMRFLQLEFALKRRVLHMETVVAYVDEKELDTTELDRIIAEMNVLVEDVEGVDFGLTHEELVDIFLATKEDARVLVDEFRDEVRSLLTEGDLSELRRRISSEDARDALKELKEEIRTKQREVLSLQTEGLLEKFGKNDAELVEGIKNGDVTRAEIRTRLEQHIREATAEKRLEIRERLRDAAEDKRIEYQEKMREYVDGKRVEYEARVRERADRVEANIRERIRDVRSGGSQ